MVVGDRPTASKAASACGVVRLRRGLMAHRGQAPRHVLPSAMQREQSPSHSCAVSVHRSSIEWQALVVVVGDRPTASKAAHRRADRDEGVITASY